MVYLLCKFSALFLIFKLKMFFLIEQDLPWDSDRSIPTVVQRLRMVVNVDAGNFLEPTPHASLPTFP
jgi:hypothetical protein